MSAKKKEYSKVITTIVLAVFSTLAVVFMIFVCYEMHRLGDLSPVGYIGPSIAGILVSVIGFYMSRAKAKSQTDLEWEKTKRLTLFREKHPNAFIEGSVNNDDIDPENCVG
jgi:Zn-dependent protease